jgi:hypothetical protein
VVSQFAMQSRSAATGSALTTYRLNREDARSSDEGGQVFVGYGVAVDNSDSPNITLQF